MNVTRSKVENVIGVVLAVGVILLAANAIDDFHKMKFELACAELHGYEQRFIDKHLPDRIFDDKGFIERCKAN